MNYLTIIATVWAICAICAVLFIRGSAMRELKPVRVRSEERPLRKNAKDYSSIA